MFDASNIVLRIYLPTKVTVCAANSVSCRLLADKISLHSTACRQSTSEKNNVAWRRRDGKNWTAERRSLLKQSLATCNAVRRLNLHEDGACCRRTDCCHWQVVRGQTQEIMPARAASRVVSNLNPSIHRLSSLSLSLSLSTRTSHAHRMYPAGRHKTLNRTSHPRSLPPLHSRP